jgi:hypothetical protein
MNPVIFTRFVGAMSESTRQLSVPAWAFSIANQPACEYAMGGAIEVLVGSSTSLGIVDWVEVGGGLDVSELVVGCSSLVVFEQAATKDEAPRARKSRREISDRGNITELRAFPKL